MVKNRGHSKFLENGIYNLPDSIYQKMVYITNPVIYS